MWCRICCVDGSRLTTPQDFNLKLHEFVHYNTYVCVFLSIKIVPPAPICKTGTWSCTGEQSTLAVPHGLPTVLVGLGCSHLQWEV